MFVKGYFLSNHSLNHTTWYTKDSFYTIFLGNCRCFYRLIFTFYALTISFAAWWAVSTLGGHLYFTRRLLLPQCRISPRIFYFLLFRKPTPIIRRFRREIKLSRAHNFRRVCGTFIEIEKKNISIYNAYRTPWPERRCERCTIPGTNNTLYRAGARVCRSRVMWDIDFYRYTILYLYVSSIRFYRVL